VNLKKNLQLELDKSKATLAQIMNSAAEGIFGLDLTGNCTFVNRACLKMLGYSQEADFLGKNIHGLIACAGENASTGDKGCAVITAVTAGEKYRNADERLRRADGTLLRTSYWGHPIIADDGKPIGAVVTFIDITEQKALEEQLRQAQKIEAIGTLAGGVAHDFNNILTAIIGFASLMEMKMAETDPLMPNLKQILSAADRAADLTRSLLAFSRKQMTDMRVVNLDQIVHGIEKMLKRLLREDIELTTNLCGGEESILADAGQLEQVLLNLTANSRDALPKGGRIIISTSRFLMDENFIRMHGYGATGPYILLEFSDNGTGMDAKTRERIFEPFFSTKMVGNGPGLGLSVCYGIIKTHNGFINCYSEPDSGTVFRLYLPLVEAVPVKNRVPTAITPPGGHETVLLAEDDPAVMALNKCTLEQFGYRVIAAADGAAALQAWRDNRDIIGITILDVIMPKQRGVDVFREIRALDPTAKIIFISGYSEEFLQKEELLSEAEIISKPVAPLQFLEMVRRVLDRS
jgi:PAS domain S-box-containing protein